MKVSILYLINKSIFTVTSCALTLGFCPYMHVAPTLDPYVTLSVEDYQENEAVIQMSWNQSLFTDHYVVYLSSIYESSETITYNSIRLVLSYNTVYNVSIVANNCRGRSIPVSVFFFTVGE